MKLTTVGAPGAVASGRADAAASAARTSGTAASVVALGATSVDNSTVGAQAALVQQAQAAVLAMPEVDAQRVAEIKAAMARGDISFDAQKLAQLIVRHHGGRA